MRVFVVSDFVSNPISLKLKETLQARINLEGPVIVRLEDCEDLLLRVRADLLAVVLSPCPEAVLDTLQDLRALVSCPLVAVGPASDSQLILRALREGADHYLDEAEVEAQLERFLSRFKIREEVPTTPTGKLIALLGTSGGSGVSTLAANLAVALSTEQNHCGLIDMKAGVGD